MYLDKSWLKTTRADDAAIFTMLAQIAAINPIMSQSEQRSINNIKYRMIRCGHNLYESELDDLRRVVVRAGLQPQKLEVRGKDDHDAKERAYAAQFNAAKAERRLVHLAEVVGDPIPGVATPVTIEMIIDDHVRSMTEAEKSESKPKAKSAPAAAAPTMDKELVGALLMRLNHLAELVEQLHDKIDRLDANTDHRRQVISLADVAA